MKPSSSALLRFTAALVLCPLAHAQPPQRPPQPQAPRQQNRPGPLPNPNVNVAPRRPPRDTFGEPLAGLTDAELALFFDGRAEFQERKTPADGLGPIFNDISCIACHTAPDIGGGGRKTTTRFGHTASDGTFDPLAAFGGSLLQDRALRGVPRENIPGEANTTARRVTTPLFGAGLIEAIPDSIIALGAETPKPAGIHGKVAWIDDVATGERRVGRFGWKAQQATLLGFAADASLNEMGITNRFFPIENAPNGNTAAIAAFVRTDGLDDEVDAVDGRANVDRLADFMRLLSPPPRRPASASALAGEQRFVALDCAACHTPSLTTGPSSIAALNGKQVGLYSDLLLHDMGELGDGIAQSAAGPRDMRTAPLWGLRVRRTFLHDGRADTVDAAIRAHAGEAANSRDAYLRLTAGERQQLLDFLDTL
jgi:CxxC motif-containing protein (DUF1111 family)